MQTMMFSSFQHCSFYLSKSILKANPENYSEFFFQVLHKNKMHFSKHQILKKFFNQSYIFFLFHLSYCLIVAVLLEA